MSLIWLNEKYGTNHLYQTPKNIVVSQKNDKEIKPELNRKTKYRKIFNEKEIKENINKRLKIAEEEIKVSKKYDYVVVNDDLNKTVKEIENIIKKELK